MHAIELRIVTREFRVALRTKKGETLKLPNEFYDVRVFL